MTTKIEGLPPGMQRPSSSSGTQAGSARPAPAEPARGPAAGDSVVNVSGEAAGLASLERAMAESPAFDAARVAALRDMLESGSYRIDAERIAAGITDFERALG